MLLYIFLILGAALAVFGFLRHRHEKAAAAKEERKPKKLPLLMLFIGIWLMLGTLAKLIAPEAERRAFGVEIMAPRVMIAGFSVSMTVLVTWGIMLIILILCLLVRIFVVPKMTEVPHGVQAVLEVAVGELTKYTNTTAGHLGDTLPAYVFSLGLFMLGSAAAELFGLRAPTADVTMTLSMGLVTFFLMNYYGVKLKGVKGRILGIGGGNAVVVPFKAMADIAIPVSLACRLFGNMLAGMIVMELLYYALGNFSFGLPSVVGLYFNLFHPCIQIFIFVTLSLTFIREAAE